MIQLELITTTATIFNVDTNQDEEVEFKKPERELTEEEKLSVTFTNSDADYVYYWQGDENEDILLLKRPVYIKPLKPPVFEGYNCQSFEEVNEVLNELRELIISKL
jgi:hypothetical protein